MTAVAVVDVVVPLDDRFVVVADDVVVAESR